MMTGQSDIIGEREEDYPGLKNGGNRKSEEVLRTRKKTFLSVL